jgi:hypothetical protein
MMVDVNAQDAFGLEQPTLFHLPKAQKRRRHRTITRLQRDDGPPCVTTKDILMAFQERYTSKFKMIRTDVDDTRALLQRLPTRLPAITNAAFETPITQGEVQLAITQGKKKSPGPDGLTSEFYNEYWTIVKTEVTQMIREMFEMDATTHQLKVEIMASLPKHAKATKLTDYRPITLLNLDYKILTRVIVNRLRPWLPDLLHADQHCGIAGSTVYGALATVTDVVAYAEYTRTPVCTYYWLRQCI